jgi:hypothetical protein
MAHFNLNDYEPVEQRIKRFYKDYKDGRIITDNITTAQDFLVLLPSLFEVARWYLLGQNYQA